MVYNCMQNTIYTLCGSVLNICQILSGMGQILGFGSHTPILLVPLLLRFSIGPGALKASGKIQVRKWPNIVKLYVRQTVKINVRRYAKRGCQATCMPAVCCKICENICQKMCQKMSGVMSGGRVSSTRTVNNVVIRYVRIHVRIDVETV